MKQTVCFWLVSLCCTLIALPVLRAQISIKPTQLGINTAAPEFDLHVAGDAFIQSNSGSLNIGFPNNGNQWQFSTINGGKDLLLRQKTMA